MNKKDCAEYLHRVAANALRVKAAEVAQYGGVPCQEHEQRHRAAADDRQPDLCYVTLQRPQALLDLMCGVDEGFSWKRGQDVMISKVSSSH